jgi:transposase
LFRRAAELGNARRFASAPHVMARTGLVPSEHCSGTNAPMRFRFANIIVVAARPLR